MRTTTHGRSVTVRIAADERGRVARVRMRVHHEGAVAAEDERDVEVEGAVPADEHAGADLAPSVELPGGGFVPGR